jgi:hypothetical protein
MSRTRLIVGGAALLAVAVGVFVLSPWWSLAGLARAAITADKQRLALYVDFPRVRENLRAQFNAQIAASMAEEMKDNPFAALGTLLGSAIVDKAVEAFVTADGFARLMQEALRDNHADTESTASQAEVAQKLYGQVGLEWLSLSAIRAFVPDETDQPAVTVLLERSGLTWRVVDIELQDLGLIGPSD